MAQRTTTRQSGPIETKPVVGVSTTILIGYVLTLVFQIWPNLRQYVTPEVSQQLPIVIGGVLGAIAAYWAPHTHRPDLPPVIPPAITGGGSGGGEYAREPSPAASGSASSFHSDTGEVNVIAHGGAPARPSAAFGGGGASSSTPDEGAWPTA